MACSSSGVAAGGATAGTTGRRLHTARARADSAAAQLLATTRPRWLAGGEVGRAVHRPAGAVTRYKTTAKSERDYRCACAEAAGTRPGRADAQPGPAFLRCSWWSPKGHTLLISVTLTLSLCVFNQLPYAHAALGGVGGACSANDPSPTARGHGAGQNQPYDCAFVGLVRCPRVTRACARSVAKNCSCICAPLAAAHISNLVAV